MTNSLARLGVLLAALSLAACATVSPGPALPPPPVPHANGEVLWGLVHTRCVPGVRSGAGPAPCAAVALIPGEDQGFVLLKDRVGVAQMLIMPTARITGIEDPRLLAPGATNYFAAAWLSRPWLQSHLPGPLPREAVSIAVNSPYGRSQDLLHLHLDCLSRESLDALRARAGDVGPHWSRRPLTLSGHLYFARWIDGDMLSADPFRLLADQMPGARRTMSAWSLVLVGASRGADHPGFVLLATRADPAAGNFASGEELQDHACALAPAPSPPAG